MRWFGTGVLAGLGGAALGGAIFGLFLLIERYVPSPPRPTYACPPGMVLVSGFGRELPNCITGVPAKRTN